MVPVLFSWIPRRSPIATVRAAAVLLVWVVLWLSAMFVVLQAPAPRSAVAQAQVSRTS